MHTLSWTTEREKIHLHIPVVKCLTLNYDNFFFQLFDICINIGKIINKQLYILMNILYEHKKKHKKPVILIQLVFPIFFYFFLKNKDSFFKLLRWTKKKKKIGYRKIRFLLTSAPGYIFTNKSTAGIPILFMRKINYNIFFFTFWIPYSKRIFEIVITMRSIHALSIYKIKLYS